MGCVSIWILLSVHFHIVHTVYLLAQRASFDVMVFSRKFPEMVIASSDYASFNILYIRMVSGHNSFNHCSFPGLRFNKFENSLVVPPSLLRSQDGDH